MQDILEATAARKLAQECWRANFCGYVVVFSSGCAGVYSAKLSTLFVVPVAAELAVLLFFITFVYF